MKIKFNLLKYLSIILLAALFFGCQEEEDNPSLYTTDNFGTNGTPVIDSVISLKYVVSPTAALAGVGYVKITGRNFLSTPSLNVVNFGTERGVVTEASATSLTVRLPYLIQDSVTVQIGVDRAISYSNTKIYSLKDPAKVDAKVLNSKQQPKSLACDKNGLLYTSVVTDVFNAAKAGTLQIKKNSSNEDSVYVMIPIADQTPTYWTDMKIGPNGDLYLVCTDYGNMIAKLKYPDWTLDVAAQVPDDGVMSFNAMDFSSDNYLWVGGQVNDNKFFSISPTDPNDITGFTFAGVIKSMRYYNNALYIAGKKADGKSRVYRFVINSPKSVTEDAAPYFDFESNFPGKEVTSITFSQDGYMYLGVNTDPGMILVYPGASGFENFFNDIRDQIMVPAKGTAVTPCGFSSLIWDGIPNSTYLYAIRTRITGTSKAEVKMIKINTTKLGAPNYGRD